MRKNLLIVKYYSYKIRLLRQGKKKRIFFKIVVVNHKNRIVGNLGYLTPHANNDNKLKSIGINRMQVVFWLLKNAVPSFFVFFLFENIGLIKYVITNKY